MKPEKPYNWDQEGDFVLDPAYVICTNKEYSERVEIKYFSRRDKAVKWADDQGDALHNYWTYRVV